MYDWESEDKHMMEKKKMAKCIFAIILTLAMVLTSIVWPETVKNVHASAFTINEDEYDSTNILTAKGDVLTSTQTDKVHKKEDGTYDGGIEVINTIGSGAGNAKALTAKYLKITYTIADISSVTDETKLFTFLPYTSTWAGWQDNTIKFKDAIKNSDNSYTSYIAVRTIKASMDEGQECSGINLEFCNSQPTITLTGYYAMTVKATKTSVEKYNSNAEGDLSSDKYINVITITGKQLQDKGIDISKYMKTKTNFTPYIQVSKAHTRSAIVFTCMNTNKASGSSNKALIGIQRDYDTNKTDYNGAKNGVANLSDALYIIHCGYGTGKEGTGVGAAGTGIYNKISSINTDKWTKTDTNEGSPTYGKS